MKIIFFVKIFIGILLLTGCTYTESLVLHENGSGKLSIKMDASELLVAAGGELGDDLVGIDTVFTFREILVNQKDSIAQLPEEQQQRLKSLEPYTVKVYLNNDDKVFFYDVFLEFEDISETENIFDVYNNVNNTAIEMEDDSGLPKQESIKVKYSYSAKVFKRDAYIVDEILHSREVGEMQKNELFMGSVTYRLNYTFPGKIKSINNEEAQVSEDGKNVMIEVPYIDYIANPDILDLEVVLE